jgi:hypothetical protein
VFTVGEGDGISGVIGTVDVVVGVGVEKGKLFSLKTTCLAI